jgi:hypothetical protein
MANFNFDKLKSPEENIKLFFEHIRQVDPEMATILETNVYDLLPLPQSGINRNALRQKANSTIEKALDLKVK